MQLKEQRQSTNVDVPADIRSRHLPHANIVLLLSHSVQIIKFCPVLRPYQMFVAGRDSAVPIATRYGLDGPGIKSRWGRDFPHPSISALGSIQPPTPRVPSLSRG
jgi:hypothetical protein